MTRLDRYIRDLRIAQALPFVREGDRLLDIGCLDDTLLRRVSGRVRQGLGIDPLAPAAEFGNVRIRRGTIPAGPGEEVLADGSFDCITMLAVLEHIRDTDGIARECARLLAPGGRLVMTVPKPAVDAILFVLVRLRLMKGMSLEEHHGYKVSRTRPTFEGAGLRLVKSSTFELGLNCLFVFEKPLGSARAPSALASRPAVQVRALTEPAPVAGGVG